MKKISLVGYWLQLSIRSKLILILVIIILTTSLFNYSSLSSVIQFVNAYEKDLSKTAAVYGLQSEIEQFHGLFESRVTVSGLAIPRGVESPEDQQFIQASQQVWSRWYEVQRIEPQSLEALFQIRAFYFGYQAYLESIDTLFHSLENDGEFIPTLLRARRIQSYLRNYVQILLRLRLTDSSELLDIQKEEVRRTQVRALSSIVLFAFFLMVFGLRFAKSLSTPIQQLASRAQKIAQGDLTTQDSETELRDEVGTLAAAFNTMNQNIHSMVESLKEKVEIEKRLFEDERKILEMNQTIQEAQFLNLQSQMSPHFFFNTLNTISRMSLFEKAPETLRLIESLSYIFRYSLHQGANLCTLEQELLLLKEYLHIQKIRYGERLRTHIIQDEEVQNHHFLLPPFTLQPFVENAIKYAVEPREEGAKILVSLSISKQKKMQVSPGLVQTEETNPLKNNQKAFGSTKLNILIKDDGPGITQEELRSIMGSMGNPGNENTGIGIRNVKQRIALSYHGLGFFSIVSHDAGGTEIHIEIPETLE